MKDWQRVEAVLFGSGKYLTEEQLITLSGVPKKNLKKALNDLKKHYEQIESSLDVFNEGDSWKLNVKEEYSSIVKNVISEAEMSRPIMETLALIAYKSPVFQSEIIDMKGAGAYEYISLLEDKGFITKEKSGRTFKLKITPKFYDYFDISGDSKLRDLFKGIKKPESMGSLEVYTQAKSNEELKEEDFTNKILDRMKKVEINSSDHEEKKKFLDDFDAKFSKAKTEIDETDKEMNEFRKVPPVQEQKTENDENLDDENEEIVSKEAGSKKRSAEIFGENNDEEETEEPATSENEDSNSNYPDKILKKFEAALDNLKSSSEEDEENSDDLPDEESEQVNEEKEDEENKIPSYKSRSTPKKENKKNQEAAEPKDIKKRSKK